MAVSRNAWFQPPGRSRGGYGFSPISEVGSGKPHDPDNQCLAEIFDRLNTFYDAEFSDDGKRTSPTASPTAFTDGFNYDR